MLIYRERKIFYKYEKSNSLWNYANIIHHDSPNAFTTHRIFNPPRKFSIKVQIPNQFYLIRNKVVKSNGLGNKKFQETKVIKFLLNHAA